MSRSPILRGTPPFRTARDAASPGADLGEPLVHRHRCPSGPVVMSQNHNGSATGETSRSNSAATRSSARASTTDLTGQYLVSRVTCSISVTRSSSRRSCSVIAPKCCISSS